MNKMKAWQGSYGVSRHDGIVSPAYYVFDMFGLRGDFFHAAIRTRAYVPAFTRASDGVRIGQWDLTETRMRDIQFLVPPASERAAIVRFLDHADRRIRRYIRAKQKRTALLVEQKQASSTRPSRVRLTCGPGRPYPAYRASSVGWLPEIPQSWKRCRVAESSVPSPKCVTQFARHRGSDQCALSPEQSQGICIALEGLDTSVCGDHRFPGLVVICLRQGTAVHTRREPQPGVTELAVRRRGTTGPADDIGSKSDTHRGGRSAYLSHRLHRVGGIGS